MQAWVASTTPTESRRSLLSAATHTADAPCSHEVNDGLFGVSPLDAKEEMVPEPKVDSRWLTPHHGSELRCVAARTDTHTCTSLMMLWFVSCISVRTHTHSSHTA